MILERKTGKSISVPCDRGHHQFRTDIQSVWLGFEHPSWDSWPYFCFTAENLGFVCHGVPSL